MNTVLIKNAKIVNEGTVFEGDVLIENEFIVEIAESISPKLSSCKIIDAEGSYLIPGAIDDQVHFREPGLTHKGDIASESRAAVAGGITSYIEQPNTIPNAITQEILEEKYQIAAKTSYANYSFMMGGTNDNLEEILKTNPKNVAGLKLFLGSSTGDMLVDSSEALEKIFSNTKLLIAVHSEDENTVKANLERYKLQFGEDIPVKFHPEIRSVEACYKSTVRIIELAKKTGAVVIMAVAQRLPEGKGFELHLESLAQDNIDNVNLLNQHIEHQIKKFPLQYMWNYNRYKQP